MSVITTMCTLVHYEWSMFTPIIMQKFLHWAHKFSSVGIEITWDSDNNVTALVDGTICSSSHVKYKIWRINIK